MFGKAAASIIAKLNNAKAAVMIAISASQIQKPYVGQTEEIIRQLFAYARAYKALHGHQLVIFIDEADALLPSRGGTGTRGVAGWEESNVATFLAEMDGMEESGALVILATNRPESIDAALLRDGRCDRRVEVKRPDENGARKILAKAMANIPTATSTEALVNHAIEMLFSPLRHLMKVKTERGTDFLNMAHTVSGAMMVGLAERAKANAFHRDITHGTMTGVTMMDFSKAIETITEEKRNLPDSYALIEFAKSLNAPVIEVEKSKPEIKFTGTLN
jgi:SpoVK/Ycf46/Vps4 family AAA+-type ATPase